MKKKRNPVKTLKNRCEKIWKDICKMRDGAKCALCGDAGILQVDHCFSRMVSQLFFDPRNGTTLCRPCHTKKSYRVRGFEKVVDELVRIREGEKFWIYAQDTARCKKPFKWTITDLEQLELKLREQLSELMQQA